MIKYRNPKLPRRGLFPLSEQVEDWAIGTLQKVEEAAGDSQSLKWTHSRYGGAGMWLGTLTNSRRMERMTRRARKEAVKEFIEWGSTRPNSY